MVKGKAVAVFGDGSVLMTRAYKYDSETIEVKKGVLYLTNDVPKEDWGTKYFKEEDRINPDVMLSFNNVRGINALINELVLIRDTFNGIGEYENILNPSTEIKELYSESDEIFKDEFEKVVE